MFETKLSLAPNCYRAFRSLGCKDQNKHSFDFNKYILERTSMQLAKMF